MDNATSHRSREYDGGVRATIPCYDSFQEATIDLLSVVLPEPARWLDTGCGTGNLIAQVRGFFPGTGFVLADPSPDMLEVAREKLFGAPEIEFVQGGTQSLDLPDGSFDVVTAMMCHHYGTKSDRRAAMLNCLRMLRKGGVCVVFENIRPRTAGGLVVGLERWRRFQERSGKSPESVARHLGRFDRALFPITIAEHLALYEEIGFETVEVLWASWMQAGFYMLR